MEDLKLVMEEGKRWEDLGMDCLINVFGRLSLEDKTLGVPFVCKSWYKASLNPLSWRILNFHALHLKSWFPFAMRFEQVYQLRRRFSFSCFLRFVVERSHGLVLELILPEKGVTFDDMVYVSEKCPALKVLVLPKLSNENGNLPKLFCKWKDLERLYMRRQQIYIEEIFLEINRNCKNFTALQINGLVVEDEALCITKLCKLKYLCLSGALIRRKDLLTVLRGCKGLEELYLRNMRLLFIDEEIAREASSIKTFKYKDMSPPKNYDSECPYTTLEYGGKYEEMKQSSRFFKPSLVWYKECGFNVDNWLLDGFQE